MLVDNINSFVLFNTLDKLGIQYEDNKMVEFITADINTTKNIEYVKENIDMYRKLYVFNKHNTLKSKNIVTNILKRIFYNNGYAHRLSHKTYNNTSKTLHKFYLV